MWLARLIIHNPQCPVRKTVDPVGHTSENDAARFACTFECKLMPDRLFQPLDRKAVVSSIERKDSLSNVTGNNILDKQQVATVILQRRFRIHQVVGIDRVHHRLFDLFGAAQSTQRISLRRLADELFIELLHGRMEDRSEHRGIDLLGDLVIGLQSGHRMEIETQRAGHIAEERGR